jgi:hypothetical protein
MPNILIVVSLSKLVGGCINMDLRKLNQVCTQMNKNHQNCLTLDDGTVITFKKVDPAYIQYDIGGK